MKRLIAIRMQGEVVEIAITGAGATIVAETESDLAELIKVCGITEQYFVVTVPDNFPIFQ